MSTILDYIKEFRLSDLGLGLWDVVVFTIFSIVLVFLIKKVFVFFKLKRIRQIERVLSAIINIAVYGILGFLLLNSILNRDYAKVIIEIGVIVVHYINHAYDSYDNFVDSILERFFSRNKK